MSDTTEQRKDNYLLFRGGIASARLTGQHYIITERQGWQLHPTVQADIASRKDLKVADLATGNGIWAINLSKHYPNAEITGLDISDQQFPASFTWPTNVKFSLYDIFDPVPAEYNAYFDVIHIRLIIAAIHNRDTDSLINNLRTMLKPGGYLQWDEVNYPGQLIVDSSMHTEAVIPSFIKRILRVSGTQSSFEFCSRLDIEFKDKGLTDVMKYTPKPSADMVQYEADVYVWTTQEAIEALRNLPGDGVKEELDLAKKELQRSVEAGEYYVYNWEVVVGRKPL